MVVQHNMQAMNANRLLGMTASAQAKSTEKLSSGYRINRAADDAAGLTISEKMRKQIKGLDQAATNAQDGISCVQTAEGALTEVHSMLQRMNELAVQASNGTMSEDDRQAIQDEIDQLIDEIDRVSETTKFNEIYLLKGGKSSELTVTYKEEPGTKIVQVDGKTVPTVYLKGDKNAADADTILANLEINENGDIAIKEGVAFYTAAATPDTEYGAQLTAKIAEVDDVIGDAFTTQTTGLCKNDKTAIDEEDLADYFNEDGTYKGNLYTLDDDGNATEVGAEFIDQFVNVTPASDNNPLEFGLHVGAESAENNKIQISIESMSAKGIGVDTLKTTGLMTEDDATAAIDIIENAIAKVSKQRSSLGAIQNRLEHTIDNLNNVVENTTAAESRIRDVDMAEEMVEYSKNNILQQAGQSMLAQANQANQGVLSLLQ